MKHNNNNIGYILKFSKLILSEDSNFKKCKEWYNENASSSSYHSVPFQINFLAILAEKFYVYIS